MTAHLTHATNWCGQTITIGSTIGRGARAGNTSEHKIGTVIRITANTNPNYGNPKTDIRITADWTHTPTHYNPTTRQYQPTAYPQPIESRSTCDINTVYLLDPNTLHLTNNLENNTNTDTINPT